MAKEKRWYVFIADGKMVDCLEESAKCKVEIKRLRGLHGIEIYDASPDDLIAVNAKTLLTKGQVNKMKQAAMVIRNRNAKIARLMEG